jgi:hypothetical protein
MVARQIDRAVSGPPIGYHEVWLRSELSEILEEAREIPGLVECRDDDADQRQGQLLESAMAVSFSVQS